MARLYHDGVHYWPRYYNLRVRVAIYEHHISNASDAQWQKGIVEDAPSTIEAPATLIEHACATISISNVRLSVENRAAQHLPSS